MKILITGHTGMLGTSLVECLSKNHNVTGLSIDTLDITDIDATIAAIKAASPDLVIHTAAYTNVDGCETEQNTAFSVNGYGTRNVTVGSIEAGAKIVYISTDYVFDGKSSKTGYQVFDTTNPINVYGQSKLMGETYCRLNPKHYILRISWLFGPHGNNFVDTIHKLGKNLEEGKNLTVVNDQFGSPTYAPDLAETIDQIIAKNMFGTYHVTNSCSCSWFEFAQEIFNLSDLDKTRVLPVDSSEYKRPATRPAFSILNNDHLKLNGIPLMRSWQEALKDHLTK